MVNKYDRIMFAGPSGFGKTTMARHVANLSEKPIPFISGSVSDLIPDTKDISHKDMLSRDNTELYKEDYQIVNLRNKLFSKEQTFVTDRSYVDSVAYFIYKQADKLPQCEIEHFISLCSMLLVKQCDVLIFLDFIPELLNSWITEDNSKRITNNYFQIMISSIMNNALSFMGYTPWGNIDKFTSPDAGILEIIFGRKVNYLKNDGIEVGVIENIYGRTVVYKVRELNLDVRDDIIKKYII